MATAGSGHFLVANGKGELRWLQLPVTICLRGETGGPSSAATSPSNVSLSVCGGGVGVDERTICLLFPFGIM